MIFLQFHSIPMVPSIFSVHTTLSLEATAAMHWPPNFDSIFDFSWAGPCTIQHFTLNTTCSAATALWFYFRSSCYQYIISSTLYPSGSVPNSTPVHPSKLNLDFWSSHKRVTRCVASALHLHATHMHPRNLCGFDSKVWLWASSCQQIPRAAWRWIWWCAIHSQGWFESTMLDGSYYSFSPTVEACTHQHSLWTINIYSHYKNV